MKYKLICMDMDGTLLNDDKVISEENLRAIRLAAEKGVKFAVCTGRIFTSADFFSDLMGVKAPVIASNGAYIREKDRNEIVYEGILGLENCRKLLRLFKAYDIYPHYYTSDTVLAEELIYSASFYEKVNKTLPKNKQVKIVQVKNWEEAFEQYNEEIFKGIGVDREVEKIQRAKKAIREDGSFEVVSSSQNNFEVMRKGVSKGSAVERLAAYYGIKREEIICIGDHENDLSMIEYAGLGVAMGNGEEVVKKAAKFITETNNNHGVAKVIKKFILS